MTKMPKERTLEELTLEEARFLIKSIREENKELRRTAMELENTKSDLKLTLEELSIHQEELRAQNEELNHSRIELEESQAKYKNLFSYAPVGYFMLDQQQRITEVNIVGAEILGYTIEHLIRKPLLLYVVSSSRNTLFTHLRSVFNGTRAADEILFSTSDGRQITAIMDSIPTFDKDHRVISSQTTIRDITDRIQAEERLRKLSHAVENSPVMVMITDTNGVIEYVNPKYTELTGYTCKEVVGRKAMELEFHDIERDTFPWQQAMEEQFWSGEYKNKKRNGELYWEKASITCTRSPDGIVRHYVKVAEDITLRKKHEEERTSLELQLRHSQKMEAMGTLAGGIAHEFNNILSIMLGLTQLVFEELPPHMQSREYLSRILMAGERGTDIVKQILSFCRTEEQVFAPMNMVPAVKEVVKMLKATFPKSLEIRKNISKNLPIVMGSATQIHQVLMNLCNNAAYAMREKRGTLEISLSHVEEIPGGAPHQEHFEGFVLLRVSDNGVGIADEIKDRIFDPFFTTKEIGKGTGLGLSVVHGIVQQHNGVIQVESQLNQGTRFSIYFPAIQKKTMTPENTEAMIQHGKERLLIVDDEPDLLAVYSHSLQNRGYTIHVYDNCLNALKDFQERPFDFDMVLTDQLMPRMTGLEFSHELMKIRPEIPVMLLTGYSELVSEAKAKALGIRRFLMKPVRISDLCQIIRDVFDEARAS